MSYLNNGKDTMTEKVIKPMDLGLKRSDRGFKSEQI